MSVRSDFQGSGRGNGDGIETSIQLYSQYCILVETQVRELFLQDRKEGIMNRVVERARLQNRRGLLNTSTCIRASNGNTS